MEPFKNQKIYTRASQTIVLRERFRNCRSGEAPSRSRYFCKEKTKIMHKMTLGSVALTNVRQVKIYPRT